ncbi:hypothetical protein DEO72_LG5g2098 [Vigna unguiculata]|uniref:Uncharacterized protein n=1 Tax=Vigna unguiculata TaxID=3917 RepID=A0A4D6LZL2_VIGUN|nr:hypothetical protein DEO72_LG5g2098 [Vigna unguiculata]
MRCQVGEIPVDEESVVTLGRHLLRTAAACGVGASQTVNDRDGKRRKPTPRNVAFQKQHNVRG